MITTSKQISEHFHSTEFRCQHCGGIKTDENLVTKMEHIFTKLQASKCIISSGYRCDVYDVQIGGFLGRHYGGLAADCVYYDKDMKIIPSKIVCCVAHDLHELNGIAKIDNNYVHLDNRQNGTYYGDETRGNSSYWTNPYEYFGVTKEEVAKYTGEKIEPAKVYSYKIGDIVEINGVYVSSTSNKKLKPAITKGTITKIVDARNPYLLDDGNIGWVNDNCIKTINKENFKIGDVVIPTKLIDWMGTRLIQYDSQYIIKNINSGKATLYAVRNGKYYVWATLPFENIKKVD